MQETVARVRFDKRIIKTRGPRNCPHCQHCAHVGRFGATLLHKGLQAAVAKRIGTAAQESISDAATLLLCGIAAGGC